MDVQCWKCGQMRPGIVGPCPYCSSGLNPVQGVHDTWRGKIVVPGPPLSDDERRRDNRHRLVLAVLAVVGALVLYYAWKMG